jgi:GTP-binding protein
MSGVSREGTDTVLRALRAQIDDTRLREKKSQEEPQKWQP